MPDINWDLIFGMIRKILILGAIVFAYLWFKKLDLKTKVKPKKAKNLKLSNEEKKKFIWKLNSLSQNQISVKEEIIQKYKFFLELLKAVENPKPDYLSPLDFSIQLNTTFPQMRDEVDRITFAFCDTLYGKIELSHTEVEKFRMAIQKILSQFT